MNNGQDVSQDISVNQGQVYCELHYGYVEYWEAKIVAEDDIRAQRPARNSEPGPDEYTACIDCLMEEIHPLPLENM